jgi:hypothetical protein
LGKPKGKKKRGKRLEGEWEAWGEVLEQTAMAGTGPVAKGVCSGQGIDGLIAMAEAPHQTP